MTEIFQSLNAAQIRRRTEAERTLPTWLANPTQFPADLNASQSINDFSPFIDQDLIDHLKDRLKIEKLFSVQKCLIPELDKLFNIRQFSRPNDVCISSPTGSGKTYAFVIPIVNYLKKTIGPSLRVLAVLPSRDLAQQVYSEFQKVIRPYDLKCAIACGESQCKRDLFRKVSNDYEHTFRDESSDEDTDEFQSTIDILVTTPGALMNLLQDYPGFNLQDLEILVMDEADKLMASYHHDWLNAVENAVAPLSVECPCKIPCETPKDTFVNFYGANGCALNAHPRSRFIHKLLFSATLSSDPQILMQMNLFQPRLFIATKPSLAGTKIRNSIGSSACTPSDSPIPGYTPVTVSTNSELLTTTAIPEQLEEKMFIIKTKDKLRVMWYMLYVLKYKKMICFVNETSKSQELMMFLNEIDHTSAANFSSKVTDTARQKIMTEFEMGKIDVLVATDIAARGMDLKGVEYVVSYDMPASGTWYAHRVGRTARAGNKGTAITLVDTNQLPQFKKVVQFAHKMKNSMRLSDVVEEVKMPLTSQGDEHRDAYEKTYENFEDKLKKAKMRAQKYRH